MTLISNLKERNIKITDNISNAVVIAYGKTEPKGLKYLLHKKEVEIIK